jgi:hypothetical protein
MARARKIDRMLPVGSDGTSLFIINHQPAYVYTFGFDRLEKTYRIFPHTAAHSAYVDQTRPQLVIPDEAHYVSIDDTVGTDYFCVLFSHQKLDFATVLQRIPPRP